MKRRVSFVQLICGQINLALLMAIIPGTLILWYFGGVARTTGTGVLLVAAHVLIVSTEYATKASWVPSGWMIPFAFCLPVSDAISFVWLIHQGAYGWGLTAFGLLGFAVLVNRAMFRRWRDRASEQIEAQLPVTSNSDRMLDGGDGDLAMMDF